MVSLSQHKNLVTYIETAAGDVNCKKSCPHRDWNLGPLTCKFVLANHYTMGATGNSNTTTIIVQTLELCCILSDSTLSLPDLGVPSFTKSDAAKFRRRKIRAAEKIKCELFMLISGEYQPIKYVTLTFFGQIFKW